MAFGNTWSGTDGGFSAAAPLDFDFNFDPALIEALPDSIPDFFLVSPRNVTTNPAGQPVDHFQSLNNLDHQTQPTEQFQALTLEHQPHPQQQQQQQQQQQAGDYSNPTAATHSRASSPSDASPHIGASSSRAGAGRQLASARREEDVDVVLKRQRNTIAARKYRQKRLDRIKELEDALEDMTKERDDLRLKLARQEAETAALKEMMQMKSGQRGSDS